MRVSIAKAKSGFSNMIKQARKEPVIITRRGKPEAVILPFEEYERLRRLRTYFTVVHLCREIENLGLTATQLYEASREELEERP